MKLNRGTILVVEDDVNQRNIIKTILSKEGFYVEDADCGKKAVEILKAGKFDLVLTDLKLPDIDGTEVLKEITDIRKNLPCYYHDCFWFYPVCN